MTGRRNIEAGIRTLLTLATVVIVIAGLKAAGKFFVPFLLALFIATVSFPITAWLRRHKVPRFFAVITTVLVDFAFLAGVVFIGMTLIGDLQEKWESKYQVESTQKLKQAEDWAVATIVKWSDIPELEARKNVRAYVTEDLTQQLSSIKVEDIVGLGTNVVGRVTSFLGSAFIVVLCTVFMLTEARMFGRRLSLIGEARGPNFERMLHAGKDIQRFLGIKTMVSLATVRICCVRRGNPRENWRLPIMRIFWSQASSCQRNFVNLFMTCMLFAGRQTIWQMSPPVLRWR